MQQMMMPSNSMMGGFGAPSPMNSMNGSMPPMQQWTGGPGIQQQPSQQQQQQQPSPFGSIGSVGPGALVPSITQSNPYALGPAPGPGAMASPSPFGAPLQQQPTQQNPMALDPFGSPAPTQPPQQQLQQQPQAPPNPVMAIDPFAAPAPQPQPARSLAVAADPFVAPAPAPLPIAADPWAASPAPPAALTGALVPSTTSNDDPFGIFGGAPAASAQLPPSTGAPLPSISPMTTSQPTPALPTASDDPWADMGFGSPQSSVAPTPAPLQDDGDIFDGGIGAAAARSERESAALSRSAAPSSPPSKDKATRKGELPPGGEWYDAKIFTPTLGVMFFKPKELVDSLFLQTDKKLVEALEDRPVVAFIVEGSSARSAGVELGHVLLKVNGIDVKNPKEASRLIKEGPRPLPLLFYVPNTTVVVAEGEHMVKYNTKDTGAPNSAKDWKPKYVVIGGIIAQPWMMNMYRSKVSLRKKGESGVFRE